MSAHTKGPWEVWLRNPTKIDIAAARPIARIAVQGIYLEDQEASANARLIGAAPDLLEALLDAQAELSCQPRRSSYVLDKVSRAISKATGGNV